jgi:peptidoglycan/xylan/chitin deacetylase (PgdA/CDA1 family)
MIDMGEKARKLVLNMARLSGLASLADRFAGGIGAILMLHRVTDGPSKPPDLNGHLAVRPAFLDAVLGEMKRLGYSFASMDEAVDRLERQRNGERFAAITLDDGYRDNLIEALPVFEKHETPFTIYVAPAQIDRTVDLWWEVIEEIVTRNERVEVDLNGATFLDCSTVAEKRAAARRIIQHVTADIPEMEQAAFVRNLASSAGLSGEDSGQSPLMDWSDVAGIAAHPLGTIGAHTVHHANLARLPAEQALRELTDSARILHERLGERPRHMAYPYGYPAAVGEREVRLAREAGYGSAVTTRHGVLYPEHGAYPHALPRISLNGRYQQVGFVRTMLSGITTPMANRGKRLVTV